MTGGGAIAPNCLKSSNVLKFTVLSYLMIFDDKFLEHICFGLVHVIFWSLFESYLNVQQLLEQMETSSFVALNT